MSKTRLPEDFEQQTPEGSRLATEAVMNLVETADAMLARIGRLLRPLKVSETGGLVLTALKDNGPLSPSDLGERLIVTRATVTGLIDSLERQGYAERTPHPTDRRSVLVRITPAGLEVAQQIRIIVHAQEKAWMADFTEAELQAFIELNHRLQQRVAMTPDPTETEPDA